MLTTVKKNNETYEDYQIKEINFIGEEYEATEQNITLIKSEIVTADNYEIEFEKNQDTGIIYRLVISKE